MNYPYIADEEILAIPVIDCGEELVDIKDYPDQLRYGLPPECAATKNDYTKMRKSIFSKLCAAQKNLPQGMYFRLYEGFRSLKVQQLLFTQRFNKIKLAHPQWSEYQQFHEAIRLVSPVTNFDGSTNVPPHNTGAAIDIEIVLADGSMLDMGMMAQDWLEVDATISSTQTTSISSNAQNNRKLLVAVLAEQGFVNYPYEWWHFSYGDRYWAYCNKKAHAIYGMITD